MYNHVTGQSVMTSEALDRYFANRDPSTFDDAAYFGIALSIYCREIYPAIDFEALDAARAALSPFGILNQDEALWRAAYPMANSGVIDRRFWEPVTGDKPVLILTGTYDTLTPRRGRTKSRILSRVTCNHSPAGHALFVRMPNHCDGLS